jgi:flagellum-specific peptidoglycan hydrolase FlgJ
MLLTTDHRSLIADYGEHMTSQESFLRRAADAARAAGHLFPEHAACEAALESGWGQSHLATQANNLFGQKQAHPPLSGTETLSLPTREYLHGAWVSVQASWVQFQDWDSCFRERMALLRSLANGYSNYREALAATTGEQFVTLVSRSWSTDPARAGKVLAVYDTHRAAFGEISRSEISNQ